MKTLIGTPDREPVNPLDVMRFERDIETLSKGGTLTESGVVMPLMWEGDNS